jgi:hypothetical protein
LPRLGALAKLYAVPPQRTFLKKISCSLLRFGVVTI